MPSDNDTCPTCQRAFTDTDDEPGMSCPFCGQELHADCWQRHACPERARFGNSALKAWNAGVRGW